MITSILGLSTLHKVIALGNIEIIEWSHNQKQRKVIIFRETMNMTASLSTQICLRSRESTLEIVTPKKVQESKWKY